MMVVSLLFLLGGGGVIIQWFMENLVFVGWDVADVTRPLVMRPDPTLVERKRGLVTI